MSRAQVYKADDAWWAVLAHQGWEDATPFPEWEDAHDHALWLSWCANRTTEPTTRREVAASTKET